MIKLNICCLVLIIENVEVGLDIDMKFHQEVRKIVSNDSTFSVAIISFIFVGHQTAFAYSRWGLTKTLNSLRNTDSPRCINALLISPIILFALLIFSKIWLSNFS